MRANLVLPNTSEEAQFSGPRERKLGGLGEKELDCVTKELSSYKIGGRTKEMTK